MALNKKTKRRVFFIISIFLMLIGTGLCLFPIIKQAYNSYLQDKMLEDVKQQILANYDTEVSAVAGSQTSDDSSDVVPGSETSADNTGSSADISTGDYDIFESLADNLTEIEDASDETPVYDKSRLRGQKCIGIITIPSIDLVYAVVEGIEDDNIGVAIGHFPDSAAIGADGNCAMAGHNGGYSGRYFGDIDELPLDAEIIMTDLKGNEYTYKVCKRFIVEPTEVSVVGPLSEEGKFITLVTCCNNGKKRYIVRAQCTTPPKTLRQK